MPGRPQFDTGWDSDLRKYLFHYLFIWFIWIVPETICDSAGYLCCNDTLHGPTCYWPVSYITFLLFLVVWPDQTAHTCPNGTNGTVLCGANDNVCGLICYDARNYACVNNTLVGLVQGTSKLPIIFMNSLNIRCSSKSKASNVRSSNSRNSSVRSRRPCRRGLCRKAKNTISSRCRWVWPCSSRRNCGRWQLRKLRGKAKLTFLQDNPLYVPNGNAMENPLYS